VEGMSKGQKGETIWVTFIDMGAKKMLFTERMEARQGWLLGLEIIGPPL
jgi:hypothetical protein